ncbi:MULTISPECIES: CobW family GTP-binding protein [Agrobacterium]|uniref:GTP-binding protein n=1 Tax=Agrobacterium rosae TaxID=1972867 RepID=A0AAW9FHA4_9HYPH|nr:MULTISPECIES: GTP-binding protein [Agrobacterium]MDX8302531.1 GTP-binding protein [Agrobacterium rosae]POO55784.1 GTP-binding protein [Agrobacterium rosae]SCX19835.1 putative GTP-binding protein YjiA [Agrobacterium sp. DSM 25558]
MAQDRIPVSIITGFLGAGKSTLLNQLLKDPAMQDAAIIINEFGDVSIDHLLVERSGDGIIELAEGCLCCTVRGELVDTLAELMDGIQTGKLKKVNRVVIETTGLADPAPVMQSIIGNPIIAQNFSLNGMVTVVDAVNGLSTLDHHMEAVKQVAVADRLVLTKQTLGSEAQIRALTDRLISINPRATIEDGDRGDWKAVALLENGLYDAANKVGDVSRWLGEEAHHDHHEHHHHDDHGHHHHHDVNRHNASIRSFSIMHEQPIDPMAIEMFVDLLRSAHGEKLLRMKAIVQLSDNPDRPLVLHGVQSIFHPPQRLAAWPDPSDRRTRMVLITHDLPEAFVKDLFGAFTGAVRIDRPDRQAVMDNPLAVPGMRF